MSTQQPDTRPGFYYVSVTRGAKYVLLRGPFINDHAAALTAVDEATQRAQQVDARCAFDAFGTCRSETDRGPGVLDRYDANKKTT